MRSIGSQPARDLDAKRDGGDEQFNPAYETVVPLNFSALRICRDTHYRLSCANDSYCQGPCQHVRSLDNGNTLLEAAFDFEPTRKRVSTYLDQAQERRALLKKVIDGMERTSGRPNKGLIMLMTFNLGYGYQFINWICSVLAHGVDLDELRPHLLVTATDSGAMEIVRHFGFHVYNPQPFIEWTGAKMSPHASKYFGADSHQALNMVSKFGMITDLITMGYDVLTMDTDFVWMGNAIDVIRSECAAIDCHGAFIYDGRPFGASVRAWKARENDSEPFMRSPEESQWHHEPCAYWPSSGCWYPQINTGLFLLRSTPETKQFVSTLVHAAPLQAWKLSDQLVWNSLAWHHKFSHLRWRILTSRRFVPGGYLHYKRHLRPFPKEPELMAIHPSDANRHTDKIVKLGRLGHWYLTEKCPHFEFCQLFKGCLPENFTHILRSIVLLSEDDPNW